MTIRSTIFALVLAAGLGACVAEEDAPPPTQAEREAALRESAFGGLVEPMDRAQEIQQLQIDRKRELDAVIDN